ncbi:hypothetical protein GQ457_15G008530 [Hibiscus cannabinus]
MPIGSEVLAGADSLPAQTSSAVDINQAVEVVVEAASDQEVYGHEVRLGVSSNLAMEVNEESHRLEAPDVTAGQVIQPAAVVQSDGAEAIVPTVSFWLAAILMSSTSFSPPPPHIFVGENYHIWVVKMKTYMQAYDLREVVEMERDPPPLRVNPTLAQMGQHNKECAKKHKAMSYNQNGVSDVIFTRIMACETPKQAWNKLKEEFMGTEKTRQQQLLNLRRDFKNLKMKESETVKQ